MTQDPKTWRPRSVAEELAVMHEIALREHGPNGRSTRLFAEALKANGVKAPEVSNPEKPARPGGRRSDEWR